MKTAVSEKTVFSERFSYISKDMSDVCGRVLGFCTLIILFQSKIKLQRYSCSFFINKYCGRIFYEKSSGHYGLGQRFSDC